MVAVDCGSTEAFIWKSKPLSHRSTGIIEIGTVVA